MYGHATCHKWRPEQGIYDIVRYLLCQLIEGRWIKSIPRYVIHLAPTGNFRSWRGSIQMHTLIKGDSRDPHTNTTLQNMRSRGGYNLIVKPLWTKGGTRTFTIHKMVNDFVNSCEVKGSFWGRQGHSPAQSKRQ